MSNPLGTLVQRLLETGEEQMMDEASRREFHREFAESISPWIQERRTQQKIAYAKGKDIVIH